MSGFYNLNVNSKDDGISVSFDSEGFYIGLSSELNLSDSFNLQTELQFAKAYKEGESLNSIIVPVMLKYYISDDFSLQAGPQLDFVLTEDTFYKTFGLGLGIGASYDFSEKFYVNTRYVFGLTNRIDEDYLFGQDVSLKFNTFQIGLGYRF